MSLILDALRKADAERERGSVPGLRSQPVVPMSEAAAAAKRPVRVGWVWVAIGVAAGLALAATWVIVGRTTQRDAAPVAANPPALPPGAPAPAPAAAGPLPAAAPVTEPTAPRAITADAAAQDIAAPAPWTRAGEPGAAAPGAQNDARPARAGAAAADAPIYPQELLPSHVRSALPQLAISGSMYSPDPAGRSLIVNGRLYRERDHVTQELALEEIRLKSAIFGFRGYRFEVLF